MHIYNDVEWPALAKQTMFSGRRLKFNQNKDLNEYLQLTKSRIAEANPRDLRFGIGFSLTDPQATDPQKWKGNNWMGDILQEIREELRGAI